MEEKRTVRIFRNGRNQAVRIPRGFELDSDEAVLRREGDCLILEPVRRKGLIATLDGLEDLDESFPDVDAELPPNDPVEL
ncbi:antitoxin [Halorhodospira halophila]|uniref:Virulence-associated protein VapB-like protein n=1 Tax=Halorhodospira halophila (strain DSM 244 / SL1) TaxID=349124 RepID=A1WV60_HALHL|nr:AbrB/MazE/SpoVT family DNA-binding domain-containing protein [Halorhodospira halophila]ABM61572.1 virulence-associated protein VapB-like protein [Halorhodospira halophila SL1]MBK1728817.1 AbrB/MazE/SpoVT family DNA-binding domain-containing protein [Halorhodospira halophila]